MSRLRRKMFILLFIFIIIVSMFIMAAFLNSPGRLTPLKDTQGNIKLTLDNDTFENTGKSRFFERRTSRVLY